MVWVLAGVPKPTILGRTVDRRRVSQLREPFTEPLDRVIDRAHMLETTKREKVCPNRCAAYPKIGKFSRMLQRCLQPPFFSLPRHLFRPLNPSPLTKLRRVFSCIRDATRSSRRAIPATPRTRVS